MNPHLMAFAPFKMLTVCIISEPFISIDYVTTDMYNGCKKFITVWCVTVFKQWKIDLCAGKLVEQKAFRVQDFKPSCTC